MAKGSRYIQVGEVGEKKYVENPDWKNLSAVEDEGHGVSMPTQPIVPMPDEPIVPMPEGYKREARWGEEGHETMFRTREDAHEFLMGVGMVPGGAWADILDAGLYMTEGDWWNMALSMGAAIPIIGTAASSVRMSGKVADKIAKGRELVKVSKHGEGVDLLVHPNGAITKKSSGDLVDINDAGKMIEKASESTGSQLKYSSTNKTLGPRLEPKDPIKGFTPEEIAAHNAKVAESGKHANVNIAGGGTKADVPGDLRHSDLPHGMVEESLPYAVRSDMVKASPAAADILQKNLNIARRGKIATPFQEESEFLKYALFGKNPSGMPGSQTYPYVFNPLNVPREEQEIKPLGIPGFIPED